MTTMNVESDGIVNENLMENSVSGDDTDEIVLNLSDTNNEDLLSPEKSRSTNNENKKEISAKDAKISLPEEKENIEENSQSNETMKAGENYENKNDKSFSQKLDNEEKNISKIQEDDKKSLESDNNPKIQKDDEKSLKLDNDPKIQKDEKLIESNNDSNSQKDDEKSLESDNDPKIPKNDEKTMESDKDDDDDNFSFKFSKKSSQKSGKKFTLIDSDSEDENIFTSKKQIDEETSSISGVSTITTSDTKSKKKSRIMKIINSDSENDSEEEKSQNEVSKPSKKSMLIDSDSEGESRKSSDESDDSEKKKKSNNSKKISSAKSDLIDSDDSESDDNEKKKKSNNSKKISSARGDLIDSDDSESDGNLSNRELSPVKIENKSEKRKGTARASKDAAMQQIHSESQRLVRESEISLPYHRPKQRTLQEFLNRKKVTASLPKTLTTAAKVKMFDDIIIKAIEEKEKEAEEFYKSSDSEEEIELSKTEKMEVENSTIQNSNDKNIQNSDDKSIQNSNEKTIQNSQFNNHSLFSNIMEEIDKENSFTKTNETNQIITKINDNSRNQNIENNETQIDFNDKNEEIENISENKENLTESNVNKISHVSRKLFENEMENENLSDWEMNGNEEKEENSKKNDNAIETDTNDFELRFSVNDFDTELCLKEIEVPKKSEISSEFKKDDKEKENEISPMNSISPAEENLSTNLNSLIETNSSTNLDLSNDKNLNSLVEISSDLNSLNEKNPSSADSVTDGNLINSKFIDSNCSTNSKLLTDSNSPNNLKLSIDSDSLMNENSEIDSNSLVNESSIVKEKEREKEKENEKEDDELADAISKGHILGLPPPSVEDKIIEKRKLKQQILSRFLNVKPTLHGSPGTTIELSQEIDHDGVKKLVDRFMRHSHTHKIEENPEVTVLHTEVTPEGLKITEQILPYKIPKPTEESDLNKPGAKLQKLREELQQRISNKRNEEWRQKEEATKALEEEYDDEELEPEDKDELPDEIDDESAESEPEENDVLIKENKKSKFAFADDEAEVSDDDENHADDEEEIEEDDEGNEVENEVENEEIEEENEENEEENDENEEKNEDNEQENDEENEEEDAEEENENQENEHPKKLRRITTAFQEDSDQESANEEEKKEIPKKRFQRTQTDVDMFDDSDGWPSDLEANLTKPDSASQTPQSTMKNHNLISPISQLTALKNPNLVSPITQFSVPKNTPTSSLSFYQDSQKNSPNKLFGTASSTVNDEELMDLCSGNFTSPVKSLKPLMNPLTHPQVTDSQLLELCSGSFVSQVDENSQDIKLTLDEASRSPVKYFRGEKDSPVKIGKSFEKMGKTMHIISSDDEEENKGVKRRKKMTKLVLSDEEDEEEREEEEEEGEESDIEEEDEERFVDYDSEENEVVVIPKNEMGKHVAKKFFEAEAELSESEWGSEDEDEKDLDKLEKEEGDEDEIDEDQMRNQLGKIHARQVQDDDQRDVRFLQDMLFEDGDLHSDGAGRERKFRWKNIDKFGWNDLKASDDQELIDDALEDQSELELRKHRYEKEKFLEKLNNDVNDIDADLDDSEIFKCGLRVVNTIVKEKIVMGEETVTVKKTKKPLAPSIIPSLLESSTINKSPSMQLPIRGSFLARGEATLARIASIIDEKDKVIRAPVNGRRFVFQHISPSVKDTEKIQDEDESSPSTSTATSRKRTSTSDSTPKSIKKMKLNKDSGGKKLFS